MGFFKDLNTLTKQGRELQKTSDPGADMRAAKEKMRALNASMAMQAQALSATPGGAIAGQVQIVSMAMTSGRVNADPVLQISALVHAPGRPPVPFSGTVAVPVAQVHRLQNGATLPAHLDPSDPTTFAFDWATATSG
jgi:hypothetical protein